MLHCFNNYFNHKPLVFELHLTLPLPHTTNNLGEPVGKQGLGWGKSKNERFPVEIMVETMQHNMKTVGKYVCHAKKKKKTNLI